MSFAPSGALYSVALALALLSTKAIVSSPSTRPAGLVADVDFQRDIRPILSNACFRCHGPDAAARKADLRLDEKTDLLGTEPGNSGVVIPGDPQRSALFLRISSTDHDEQMPPPHSGLSLDDAQIELIRQWIQDGARWERHWAFIPPERTNPPRVSKDAWCRDPIDQFTLAHMERATLQPAPEATREMLARRVSFDLTGLPPSLEQTERFLADTESGAYERLVDRLLDSPAFGERMATKWLDLARFADTHGYQTDVDRPMWPYRDWVIEAFNQNLPFDDFITWQLAGDLLSDPTHEQRLATAFNRLHRQTNEGGSVEEEYRVEYVADRVHTFGTAILGLTTECARCHDHKFDPISQNEYYELFAFFDDIDESGLYSHFTNAVPTPTLSLSTQEQRDQLARLHTQVDEAEADLKRIAESRRSAFNTWLEESADSLQISGMVGHFDFEGAQPPELSNQADPSKPGKLAGEPKSIPGSDGNGILLSGENNAQFPGIAEFSRTDPFTLSLFIRPSEITDRAVVLHRSRAWTDAGSQGYQILLENGRPSFSLIHFWPGNAISIRTKDPLQAGQWTQLTCTYDGSSEASGLKLYLDGERVPTEVLRDNLSKPITGGGPGAMTIGQRFRDRGFKNGAVDELKVFNRCLSSLEARHLFDGKALNTRTEELLPFYLAVIDSEYRKGADSLRGARQELARALDGVHEIMTMSELPEPRASYVLERGRYDQRGQQVLPGTPESIMSFPQESSPNRLGLARWATDPDHPLTARVAVNRLWELAFGRGLVATPEDFGSQGLPPSHPQLLDVLALDFIESDWDIKGMMKRLVTSSTYRQRSQISEEVRALDPENILLTRGPSGRLDAEMIRDHALAASGLLVSKVGGPSVYPYQPAGLWQEKSGRVYPQSKGESLYRRSLYTFWKRTSPPPSMMLFDAANRNICIARRSRTSTPLQALVLLNDPQFVEAARVLAERSLEQGGTLPEHWIRHAFRLLTSRQPTKQELAILIALYIEELESFGKDEEAARAIATTGEAPTREDLAVEHVAAMTVVCSTIMNSDAAVMRR